MSNKIHLEITLFRLNNLIKKIATLNSHFINFKDNLINLLSWLFTRARKKERKKGIMPYDFNDLINSIIYIEKRDNIYLYTFKNVLNSSCKYVHFFFII